jgi:hypothetical protein
MTSAPLRLRVNTSVCTPAATNEASRSPVSPSNERRDSRSSSTNGGCHNPRSMGPRGEPSSSIAATCRPVSVLACAAGLPMVALASRNVGSAP